jgi:hypothetical protein
VRAIVHHEPLFDIRRHTMITRLCHQQAPPCHLGTMREHCRPYGLDLRGDAGPAHGWHRRCRPWQICQRTALRLLGGEGRGAGGRGTRREGHQLLKDEKASLFLGEKLLVFLPCLRDARIAALGRRMLGRKLSRKSRSRNIGWCVEFPYTV